VNYRETTMAAWVNCYSGTNAPSASLQVAYLAGSNLKPRETKNG
jgi:hypothetical protein